jgi:ferritin-like metal-binding protein YciE
LIRSPDELSRQQPAIYQGEFRAIRKTVLAAFASCPRLSLGQMRGGIHGRARHGACERTLADYISPVISQLNPTPAMIHNLEQLYQDQLRDLHSAETQLIAALPEMISHSTNDELREAFTHHLEETKGQLARITRICADHDIDAKGEECDAMNGLIKEARKHLGDTEAGVVRDAVLIACANRVEHYEIAAYGVAKAFAEALGYDDDVELLSESLDEESAADTTITRIATGGIFRTGINEEAIR